MAKRKERALPSTLGVAAVFAAAVFILWASPANAAPFCTGPGYKASQLLDSTNNVLLEWSVCGAGVDVQLSASTTEWIQFGWGAVAVGSLVDVVVGNVVAGVPTVRTGIFLSFSAGDTPHLSWMVYKIWAIREQAKARA